MGRLRKPLLYSMRLRAHDLHDTELDIQGLAARARCAFPLATPPALVLLPSSFHSLSHAWQPVLVLLRPSSEAMDDPSKLARFLFKDGG